MCMGNNEPCNTNHHGEEIPENKNKPLHLLKEANAKQNNEITKF